MKNERFKEVDYFRGIDSDDFSWMLLDMTNFSFPT